MDSLSTITPVTDVPFMDALLSKGQVNDYVFGESFIDVCILSKPITESSIVVDYCYRRLWESICLRRKKKSFTIYQVNQTYFHFLIDYNEALQFLNICIPSNLRRVENGTEIQNAIEFTKNCDNVVDLMEELLTSKETRTTNISYIRDICRMKQFDWKPSYDKRRLSLISKLASMVKTKEPMNFVADMSMGTLLSDDDNKRGIVTFTCFTDIKESCDKLLSCLDDNANVTDVRYDKSKNIISVTCYIEKELTNIQRDEVLKTRGIISYAGT